MSTTPQKKVVVFDYGFGNVRSAERALARVGADVEITRDYETAMNADGSRSVPCSPSSRRKPRDHHRHHPDRVRGTAAPGAAEH
ncbi:hypothetical protein ACFWFX_30395, partial [Streptomyces roseolus]